jgi:hypothetical protein
VSLSAEQRLERQRDRWRNKQARKRKRGRDAAWLQRTNFGYFETLEVLHYNRLIEVLVNGGWLAERDVHSKPRVDEAVDLVFGEEFSFHWPVGVFDRPRLGPDSRGTVSIKVTAELVDHLVAYEVRREYQRNGEVPPEFEERLRGCRRALRGVAEQWLFMTYATHIFNPTLCSM